MHNNIFSMYSLLKKTVDISYSSCIHSIKNMKMHTNPNSNYYIRCKYYYVSIVPTNILYKYAIYKSGFANNCIISTDTPYTYIYYSVKYDLCT